MSIKSVNRAIAKSMKTIRGEWVLVGGYYESNAFDFSGQRYVMSITKEDEGWIFFCEDHEPDDIFENKPFKTLKEAMAFGEEFGESFQICWEENTEFVVQCVEDKMKMFGIDMTGDYWGLDRMVQDIAEAVRYKFDATIPYGFRLVEVNY